MSPFTKGEICSIVSGFIRADNPPQTNVWKTTYKVLLWYDQAGQEQLPHIIDFNLIKKKGSGWYKHAKYVDDHLKQEFGVDNVGDHVDQLMVVAGKNIQRQNYTGIGFTCLIQDTLKRFCNVSSRMEIPVASIRGFEGADEIRSGFGNKPIDLIVRDESDFRLVISCKWSMRHDRIDEMIEQARILKQIKPTLTFFAVTNEFMKGRLQRAIDGNPIDAIYHVRLPLLRKLGQSVESTKLKDLSQLYDEVTRIFSS